jgi:hypothetical protein
MTKQNTTDTETTSNPEHEKLMEVLKFTPCTYKIRVYGYGGEYVMGRVDRKIYDYFKKRRLDFSEFCYNDDYATEHDIPEEMWPFSPGSWYDCDGLAHVNGADVGAATLEIDDEHGTTFYTNELCNVCDDDIEFGGGDEAYIHHNLTKDSTIFFGISSEKGLFFEGEIPLTAPFDKQKLSITIEDIDGNEIMSGAEYDGEYIDCLDMSTNGKGYDMYLYALKDDGTTESYHNMDSIEYPMTEWFPKKIKPVYEGVYEVCAAGKNGWKHQAKWNGTVWLNTWGDEEIKIKEWRGLAVDPDAEVVAKDDV